MIINRPRPPQRLIGRTYERLNDTALTKLTTFLQKQEDRSKRRKKEKKNTAISPAKKQHLVSPEEQEKKEEEQQAVETAALRARAQRLFKSDEKLVRDRKKANEGLAKI